jgi:hypothetical protein
LEEKPTFLKKRAPKKGQGRIVHTKGKKKKKKQLNEADNLKPSRKSWAFGGSTAEMQRKKLFP